MNHKGLISKFVFPILVLVLTINITVLIYANWGNYMTPFDERYWTQRFLTSQWILPDCVRTDPHINPQTCTWDDNWYNEHKNDPFVPYKSESIGDDGVYMYVASRYMHGIDPTTLNAEIPPVGKYLLGLVLTIFHNAPLFALFSGITSLLALYLLNTAFFKNKSLAILPVVLFSFEPIFKAQLVAPFLDLMYLAFFCFSLYFFIKKRFIISGIFLGLMMGTKASSAALLLTIFVLLIYLLLENWKKNKKELLGSVYKPVCLVALFASIVFMASYFRFFMLGHSVIDFLKVQKWIIHFYSSGAKGSFISIWQILASGTWQTWWGQTLNVSEWWIGWPILLIISIFSTIYFRHSLGKMRLLVLWIVVYLIFLMVVPVWPRYLLLLLPFLYNLSIWGLSKNIRLKSLFRLLS